MPRAGFLDFQNLTVIILLKKIRPYNEKIQTTDTENIIASSWPTQSLDTHPVKQRLLRGK